MRTLIGGIGYAWQGDLAFGTTVVEALRPVPWPADVEVADLSHNPIAVFQQIRAQHYTQLILVGAVQRGRPPGKLFTYRPTDALPHVEEIQARIVESGSGIISLDNIVIISRFYDALPPDTQIIEVEPVEDSWGADLSPAVQVAVSQTIALIKAAVGGFPVVA
jgi:hydrogenase maturation protease